MHWGIPHKGPHSVTCLFYQPSPTLFVNCFFSSSVYCRINHFTLKGLSFNLCMHAIFLILGRFTYTTSRAFSWNWSKFSTKWDLLFFSNVKLVLAEDMHTMISFGKWDWNMNNRSSNKDVGWIWEEIELRSRKREGGRRDQKRG